VVSASDLLNLPPPSAKIHAFSQIEGYPLTKISFPVRPESPLNMARYLNGAVDKFLEGLESGPQNSPSSRMKSAPDMEP
jgi:hypothetical protein